MNNFTVISKQATAITVLDLCPELGLQKDTRSLLKAARGSACCLTTRICQHGYCLHTHTPSS